MLFRLLNFKYLKYITKSKLNILSKFILLMEGNLAVPIKMQNVITSDPEILRLTATLTITIFIKAGVGGHLLFLAT